MPDINDAAMAAALEECAREPVHIPGAIQSCGCLISFDSTLDHVLQVSANLEDFFGIPVPEALTTEPEQLLGRELLDRLRREMAGRERYPGALLISLPVDGRPRRFYITAYRSGQRILVEIEAMQRDDSRELRPTINHWLFQIDQADCPQEVLDILVRCVQQLTGHERVMVYKFDPDANGSVVAESCTAETYSYLGHHFPASDIPAQVRQLYSVNRVRSIPDATAESAPLVPACDPLDGSPVDLSQGALRAVSPIHLTYLRNMGVGAALSIAMHDDTKLWGLLSCHGLKPTPLSPTARDNALTLVQMASSRLMLLQARSDSNYLQQVRDSRELLLALESGSLLAPKELLQRHGSEWLALFQAQGVALLYQEETLCSGVLPPDSQLRKLTDWLSCQHSEAVWSSSTLGETPPGELIEAADFCGLLAVRLPGDAPQPGWFLLFRPEQIESRIWAGKPEDLAIVDHGKLTLSPRHSFKAWKEEIRGSSRAWTSVEQQAAKDLGEDLAILIFSRQVNKLNSHLADANRKLKQLAQTDALSGLPNRRLFEDQVERSILRARRRDTQLALLFLDLDRFKQVNDSFGHQAGDTLIRLAGDRLRSVVRDTDTVSRLGGDEFAILLDDIAAPEYPGTIGERLVKAFREPFKLADQHIQISVSIGIACFPSGGDSFSTLTHNADLAMYRAKQQGRNNYQYYDGHDA